MHIVACKYIHAVAPAIVAYAFYICDGNRVAAAYGYLCYDYPLGFDILGALDIYALATATRMYFAAAIEADVGGTVGHELAIYSRAAVDIDR